jgi:hypothetical protein
MESKTKLLDQMRHVLRLKHLSIRTETGWCNGRWNGRQLKMTHDARDHRLRRDGSNDPE